jgi:hypothetical protein
LGEALRENHRGLKLEERLTVLLDVHVAFDSVAAYFFWMLQNTIDVCECCNSSLLVFHLLILMLQHLCFNVSPCSILTYRTVILFGNVHEICVRCCGGNFFLRIRCLH